LTCQTVCWRSESRRAMAPSRSLGLQTAYSVLRLHSSRIQSPTSHLILVTTKWHTSIVLEYRRVSSSKKPMDAGITSASGNVARPVTGHRSHRYRTLAGRECVVAESAASDVQFNHVLMAGCRQTGIVGATRMRALIALPNGTNSKHRGTWRWIGGLG